jgi:hypothetical protein
MSGQSRGRDFSSLSYVNGYRRGGRELSYVSDRFIPDERDSGHTISHSAFWGYLMDGIYGSREGGAKIVIDAENSALGSGKTSAAIALARRLSKTFDYDLNTADLTLSGEEYVSRYRQHPGPEQPSVLILDEAVGAGAGDARRAMAQSNLDLASAWQTARVKRVVTLVTVGHWGDMDKRLKRLADYRLRCSEKPVGEFLPYKVTTDFSSGDVRTKRIGQPIQFPDVAAHDCPLYDALDDMKTELLDAATWDADELRDDEDVEEDDGPPETPHEIAADILDNEELLEDRYIADNNGRSYIDRDEIELDYGIGARVSKKVKKLLRREVDTDM